MARMKDEELRALLANVESEIGGLIRAERLNKAEGELPEETPGEESPPPPAAEGSAQAPEGEAPMEAAPEGAPAEAPQEPGMEGQEGQEGEVDLKSEYLKLGQEDPEALKEHYLACVEALQEIMGQGQGQGQAPEGAPEQGAPPAGPEMGAPAMKAELAATAVTSIDKGKDKLKANEVTSIGKSEAEYGRKIKEIEGVQGQLIKAMDKFLGHPLRKAVTTTAGKPGSEAEAVEPTRNEIMAKLSEKAQTTLKKSDRERINKFATKMIGYEDIKDLLVDNK